MSDSMAIGLDLSEIDLLLAAISRDDDPTAKLLRHRLWELRVRLLKKMVPQMDTVRETELSSQLRVVTD